MSQIGNIFSKYEQDLLIESESIKTHMDEINRLKNRYEMLQNNIDMLELDNNPLLEIHNDVGDSIGIIDTFMPIKDVYEAMKRDTIIKLKEKVSKLDEITDGLINLKL